MKTFSDTSGRTWTVAITVQDVKRVRHRLGIDLYGLVGDGFSGLGKLLSDPVMLVDVLFVLVEPQATEADVSDESFGGAFSGDVLEAGASAFLEALADFFPNPRHRDAIRRLIAKGEELGTKVLDRAMKLLDTIDLDSEADQLIGLSGGSPESPESTPTH